MAISIANATTLGRQATASINDLANRAVGKTSEATAASQKGLDALLGLKDTVSGSTSTMREYGSQVANIAGQLPKYANEVSNLGKSLSSAGNQLNDQGSSLLGISNDILNMNGNSSSPYVQELLKLYGAYNPEDKVSFAVQDVNNSYETGRGELQRQKSRQGITPGSGRNSALDQQYQIALNTARAAAATRARSLGLSEQTEAFSKLITGSGTAIGNQAKDYLLGASSVLSSAVGAQNTAAGIMSNSAALFGNAVDIESKALNSELGYASSVVNQQNTVASALQREGALLDAQSARELSFMQSQMSVPMVSSTITSATESYNPWDSTGHSSTYWQNKLSSEDYTDLASQMAALSAVNNTKK